MPRAWPSFDWCGTDPIRVGPPVPEMQYPPMPYPPMPYPPIPELLDAATDDSRLPPAVDPPGDQEPLLPIEVRRIRIIGAYWHTGWPFARPGAFLRQAALHRLAGAAAALPDGFGLAVWDAWRDTRLQERLHEAAYADVSLPPGFVSPPSLDPTRPAPHSTGGTVDLTLTWHHVPLVLGTQFDAFVPAAHARALESDDEFNADHISKSEYPHNDGVRLARDLRRMLRSVMVSAGFVQLNCEWWHFEYGTRLWAAVTGREPLYGGHVGPDRH